LKFLSPSKEGRRDLGKWTNNCRRMGNLEGGNIGAVVDGKRVTVVSGESEKSRVVPFRNVSRRRVIIPIDVVLVARKGGEYKNLGTGERSRRRGGGRSDRRRSGGREERRRRRKIFNRIHNNIFFFFLLTLARRKSQRQVDNNGKNDRADGADGRALCVDGDRRERSGGEGDDGDDDSRLSDWLGFDFEGEFHEQSQQRRGRW
jgi:hypothetical protein